jgi:uncharacterized heparinase superfamily protein
MSAITKALLYQRTVANLRPVQIWGRILFNLRTPRVSTSTELEAVFPEERPYFCPKTRQMLIEEDRFHFLNVVADVKDAKGWNAQDRSQLWLYNLHYFDYLLESNAERQSAYLTQFIQRWILENPPYCGNGWLPYPLSLRIVNWIKWAVTEGTVPGDFQLSLTIQCRYLLKRIEHHLQGNHLFVNGKALVFAGLFFNSSEGEGKQWFDRGMQILNQEIPEQILEDGSNYEQSPMYHALILEDILDLISILRAYNRDVPKLWVEKASLMLTFLKAVTHPDGDMSFFNDAVKGVASTFPVLKDYTQKLGLSITQRQPCLSYFPNAGFVRFEKNDAVMIIDGGRVGPGHVMSHVHADNLSFELSYKGQRIFVNSGVSQYALSKERLRQRGTAAHNTVEIDGLDQSEVWSSFRVARMAHPTHLTVEERPTALFFSGGHDGYIRMGLGVGHKREIEFAERMITISDYLEGHGCHQAKIAFHVHPELSVTANTDGSYIITQSGTPFLTFRSTELSVLEDSTYHPEFGLTVPSKKLVVSCSAKLPFVHRSVVKLL